MLTEVCSYLSVTRTRPDPCPSSSMDGGLTANTSVNNSTTRPTERSGSLGRISRAKALYLELRLCCGPFSHLIFPAPAPQMIDVAD